MRDGKRYKDGANDTRGIGPVRRPRAGGAKKVRWTTEMRETFFAHLAADCNVTRAAAAIGLQPPQVHYRRRKHKPFAAEWDEALRAGHALLEMRLISHVLTAIDAHTGGAGQEDAGASTAEPIHWDNAFRLYALHKTQIDGRGGKRGAVPKPATPEQTNAAILRKLASLDAARARATGRAAARGADAPAMGAGEGDA